MGFSFIQLSCGSLHDAQTTVMYSPALKYKAFHRIPERSSSCRAIMALFLWQQLRLEMWRCICLQRSQPPLLGQDSAHPGGRNGSYQKTGTPLRSLLLALLSAADAGIWMNHFRSSRWWRWKHSWLGEENCCYKDVSTVLFLWHPGKCKELNAFEMHQTLSRQRVAEITSVHRTDLEHHTIAVSQFSGCSLGAMHPRLSHFKGSNVCC